MLGKRADDMIKKVVPALMKDVVNLGSIVVIINFSSSVICLEIILLTLIRFFLPSFLEVLSVCLRMRTVNESNQL